MVGMVAHVYNHSYLGGGRERYKDCGPRSVGAKLGKRSHLRSKLDA
jgi:hypothetical protein